MDIDYARICQQSYYSDSKWDMVWPDAGGIYVSRVGTTVCFRGSADVEDWLRDFDALSINDPLLGGLHAGFARNVQTFFTSNQKLFNSATCITGHSLGAARALIFAGYMVQAGIVPEEVVVFGSPRPGFQKLCDILQPVTIRSYKNRTDPVTCVPIPAYPLLPYTHPREAILLNCLPKGQVTEGAFDFLEDHHIELYLEGLLHLTPPNGGISAK